MTAIIYPLPPKGVPLRRVAELQPRYNWGMPQGDDALDRSYQDAITILGGARLTELDVACIQGLRLGSEFDDETREDFKVLVSDIQHHLIVGREVIGIKNAWVKQLLTFVSPFCFDSETDQLINEQELEASTDRYVERGFGAPLTALYLLMLRSRFWQLQLGMHCKANMVQSLLARKSVESRGHTFAEILGDPFTSPSTKNWESIARTDFFLIREDLVFAYLEAPESNTARAIVEAMLLLVNIAAKYVGGRLQAYIGEYELWLNHYVVIENGAQ